MTAGGAAASEPAPVVAQSGRPSSNYPPEVVRHLRTPVVLACIATGSRRRYVEFGDEHFFTCPECKTFDHNLPTAQLSDDGWTWRCVRCHANGTRWQLEQVLLADPVAVRTMLRLVEEWSS